MSPRARHGVSALALITAFSLGAASRGAAHAEGAARDATPHAMIERFGRALSLVEHEYVDPVDRGRLVGGAIRGMIGELDPHSEYFDPSELADFNEEIEGKFGGVGLEIDGSGELLVVVAPIEGGPADRAGILPGDKLVAIDGVELHGAAITRTLRTLRGAPGTKVAITVVRASAPKPLLFTLVREEISVPSVDVAVLPKNVAYLRIRVFQETSHDHFVKAVARAQKLLSGHVDGAVIDLRRNPGGLVDQATGIADELLDSGGIYSLRGHSGALTHEEHASAGGVMTKTPLVVLVDEGSASAAELLAGALQDNHRATIIGAATFGKGSVQSLFNLPDGQGAVKLTTARYYSPSGRAIQAQGILPDVVVDATRVLDLKSETPPQKERDLPHALAAEAPSSSPSSAPHAAPSASTSTSPSPSVASPSVASPSVASPSAIHAPDLDKDYALRVAWGVLTGVVMKAPAR
jgi:carboxyl-terminal processing protease